MEDRGQPQEFQGFGLNLMGQNPDPGALCSPPLPPNDLGGEPDKK